MSRQKSPAPPQHRAHRKTTTTASTEYPDSTVYSAADGYTAPTADERREEAVKAEAHAMGFRLAVRCRACGAWCVSDRSVREHLGPVCRAKAVNR
jgi:hypothetical protein